MKNQELYALLTRCMQKDKKAIARLCETQAPYVLFMCKNILGNWQDAEDAAQEVLIKLHKKIVNLQAPEAYTVWLHKVVFGTCSNMRRKSMMQKQSVPLEDAMDWLPEDAADSLPSHLLEKADERARIMHIIEGMPYYYHMSLILYYYEGLPYGQIAELLGITPGAVDGYLRRGKRILKERLAAEPTAAQNVVAPTMAMAPALHTVIEDAVFAADVMVRSQVCLEATGVLAVGGGLALKQGITALLAGTVTLMLVGSLFYGSLAAGNGPAAQRIPPAGEGTVSPAPGQGRGNAGFHAADDKQESLMPAAANAPGMVEAQVAGAVHLVNNNGTQVTSKELDMRYLKVNLLGPDGEVAAAAPVQADGTFSFGTLSLQAGERYSVRLVLPAERHLVAAGSTPLGIVQFVAGGENRHELLFQFTESERPECTVLLLDSDCACGHVNPRRIEIDVKDALPVSVAWKIVAADDGVVLAGTGTVLEQELLDLRGTAGEGVYTLEVVAKDLIGNTEVATQVIRIVAGGVEANEFD